MPPPHPLLELQRIDSAGDGLRREREALPERAALAANQATLERLAAEREATREALAALGREERRVETEIAAIREQAREVETLLYSGTVRASSELSGIQAKLASLRGQQAALEDEELAILEKAEALEAQAARLDQERSETEGRRRDLASGLAAGEERIDGLLAEVARERGTQRAMVPAAWLTAYERLRSSPRLGGVVTATLEGDYCGACRTSLPVMHVTRLRAAAPDDVVSCQSCKRVLVAPDAPG
jgi:predicted  nucleic acid-binding Zn-ribbon protein